MTQLYAGQRRPDANGQLKPAYNLQQQRVTNYYGIRSLQNPTDTNFPLFLASLESQSVGKVSYDGLWLRK